MTAGDPYPIWLTGGDWPLLGFVHAPAGPARGAVVLCPPLFGEQLAAWPLYRALGRALAQQGLLALRFDYEGCGDSGGPSTGPGRLDAWLGGVDDAASTARELCDGPITFFGARSGALVAAAAAGRRSDVDAIVLWDPWRSGKSFLRRERALHALQFRTPPDSGHLEVAGLVLDAGTAGDLASLRLPHTLRARRALVVVRPGTAQAAIALETRRGGSALRTTADALESVPGEQEALFEGDALRRRIPVGTIAKVTTWLAGTAHDDAARVGAALPGADHRRAGSRRPPVPAVEAVAVPPAAPGERTVYERAVRIGPHGLFGVETMPHPGISPETPVVLFFPSGMDSHVGPHRLWVSLARKWASLGVRCVRVDLSGLGESPPRPGRPELVVRAPEAFDDVADAVRAVGGPRRTVLVGLCSSAYQVLESAIELRPLGVLAVNPLLRFMPPEVEEGGAMSTRRRICQLRRDWELAGRRMLPAPVVKSLADLRRWGKRCRRVLPGARHATASAAQLGLAGVDVRVVCRPYEADQLAVAGLVDRPRERVRIEVMPDLEHSLALAAQRQVVGDWLTAMLRAMTGSVHPAPHTWPSEAPGYGTPGYGAPGYGAPGYATPGDAVCRERA